MAYFSSVVDSIFVTKVVDEESWIFGFDAMGEVTARPQ